jgi:hypothetical protein
MRGRKQRNYGQDQPWREERRQRHPNEPYGAGADYRGEFGPESYGERDRREWRDWNDRRSNPRATFGFGADDNVERGGSYAYGSPYGQGGRAEELAERVRGVNDVHNQLRVVRGEPTTGATSPSMPQTGRGRTITAQPSGVAHDRERER